MVGYWIQDNVTPIRRQGVIYGYISVISKPTADQVAEAEQIYSSFTDGTSAGQKMWCGEVIKPVWHAPMASLRRIAIAQRASGSTALAAVLPLGLGMPGRHQMTQHTAVIGSDDLGSDSLHRWCPYLVSGVAIF